MHRLPPFWIATIAILAATAVLFVLITPAPDELPSTGPHALMKIFLAPAGRMYLSSSDLSPRHGIEAGVIAVWAGIDLLSYTCARLC